LPRNSEIAVSEANSVDTEPHSTTALGGDNTQGWNWHPNLPIKPAPVFNFPPTPVALARWFAQSWLQLSNRVITLAISVLTWLYLQPALERCREIEFGWIAQMWGRNIALMLIIAGGLHLYFCKFKKQDKTLKFDKREQTQDHKAFTFNSQILDNMFWSLASGVTIWTAFEAASMWAFANGYITLLTFEQQPVWFVLWIIAIPMFNSMHFYLIHRLLHWPVLYKRFHSLHHRNVNVGPWAGISMHPLEHVFYFSSVLIHWVIASHPVHVIYNLQFQSLNAVYGHCGFENLLIGGKRRLALGTFYHQLHHRFFECNYGTAEVPVDVWVKSFHDGSAEAREIIRRQRQKLHA
jgi:lathosterol oxidase